MTNAAEWPIACGTGHRPTAFDLPTRNWLRHAAVEIVSRLRDHHGTRIAICGMATGWDTWWGRAAVAGGLRLWAYVPFPQQPDAWPPAARHAWQELLDAAERVRLFGNSYAVGHFHARNHGMLDDSNLAVAAWRPTTRHGGTYRTVAEAERRHMPIIHIDPDRRDIPWPPSTPPQDPHIQATLL